MYGSRLELVAHRLLEVPMTEALASLSSSPSPGVRWKLTSHRLAIRALWIFQKFHRSSALTIVDAQPVQGLDPYMNGAN